MCNFVNLNLHEYYNHKSIDDGKSTLENKGFWGTCFDPQSLPNSLETITIENIPFVFPDKSSDKYDNIACEEQTIYIPHEKYTTLHLLGFCEWGDYNEKIKLIYEGNVNEEIDIFFYDTGKFRGLFSYDTVPTKEYKIALKADLNTWVCYIYYSKTIIKQSQKILTSIKLPFNPNMHIMAITLEVAF